MAFETPVKTLLTMRINLVLLLLFITCNTNGQHSPADPVKGREKLEIVQSTTLIIPVDFPRSDEGRYIKNLFKENWTVSKVKIINRDSLPEYFAYPGYTFLLEYTRILDDTRWPCLGLIQGGYGCKSLDLECNNLKWIMSFNLAYDYIGENASKGTQTTRPYGHLYELFIRHFNNTLARHEDPKYEPKKRDNHSLLSQKPTYFNGGKAELQGKTILFSLEDIGPNFDQALFESRLKENADDLGFKYEIVPPETIAEVIGNKDDRYVIMHDYTHSIARDGGFGFIYSVETGLHIATISTYEKSKVAAYTVASLGLLILVFIVL